MKNLTIHLLLPFIIISCGPKEVDKIGEAQQCLDTATKGNATNCMDLVDGMDSVGAYNIRCASKFINEGFGTTELMNSLSQLTSGSSGITSFMDYIAFSSAGQIDQDDASSSLAFDYCYKSGSKGATMLAAFSSISTSMYKYFNSCDSTSCSATPNGGTGRYSINTCISGLTSSSCFTNLTYLADFNTADSATVSLQTSLGSVIISTYQLSCAGTGANKTLCESFESAITDAGGTSNKRKVAAEYLKNLLGLN